MSEISFKSFKDEISLSRLGMGNMRLPVKAEEPGQPIDYEKAKAIIDRAMEAGINFLLRTQSAAVVLNTLIR